ncbi:MAG TPA: peptidylprolyl isomerase [Gemmatimonadaceae bacterium]|nr:peptidylprolyl isomerase [Gemmatimonadaceae bacterium]
MRSLAKYIWIFVFLAFVGGFLLADMSGIIGQGSVTPTTVVAKVNGDEIPYIVWENLTRSLTQQQEQQGSRSMNLDERLAIEDQAFDQLVSDLLLQQEYERRGIRVTDDEIILAARTSPPPQFYSTPELQTDGRFDPEKYERFLQSPVARQQGLLAQLEGYYRSELPRNKLFSQLVADAWVSDARLLQDFKDQRDSASVSFVALRPTPAQVEAVTVTDAEAKAYYDSYKGRWEAPGRAVVSVIGVNRVPSAADTAATVARLRELRTEIVSGTTSFEDAARRASDDSVSAPQGGDLGRGPRGRFVPDFETAAFALRAGEVSQPVKSQFGWHLIKATERKGDTLALRHILVTVKQADSSAAAADRLADRLAILAGGASEPEKFDSAAAELELPVTQLVVSEGQSAVLAGRQVGGISGYAFGGAGVGDVSDLMDDPQGYYLVRVDSLTRGGEQPLSVVKADIVQALKERKAVAALMPQGEALLADAKATSLEAAAQKAGLQLEKAGPFNRLGFVQGLGFYNEAVGAAFGLAIGTPGVVKTADAVVVLRPDARTEASVQEFEAQKATQRQQTLNALREAKVRGFLEALRRNAKIDDRRQEINAALRRQVVQ